MVACRFKAMLYCRWAFDSLLSRFDCSHLRFSIFRSLYLPLFESLWLPAGTAVRPPRFPARMCTCGQGSISPRRLVTSVPWQVGSCLAGFQTPQAQQPPPGLDHSRSTEFHRAEEERKTVLGVRGRTPR